MAQSCDRRLFWLRLEYGQFCGKQDPYIWRYTDVVGSESWVVDKFIVNLIASLGNHCSLESS